jgi:hypothetical protein
VSKTKAKTASAKPLNRPRIDAKGKGDTEVAKRERGRPTIFSDALAAKICERIANGELIHHICRDEDMPGVTTITRWKVERSDFRTKVISAQEIGAHAHVAEAAAISDEDVPDGTPGYQSAMEQRRKARIGMRQWMAERYNPKELGQVVDVRLKGDGLALTINNILPQIAPDMRGRTLEGQQADPGEVSALPPAKPAVD